MRGWKKFCKIAAISLLVLSATVVLLFSTFVVNPLESDYADSLLDCIPEDSDAVVYCDAPQQLWKDMQTTMSFRQLLQDPRFQDLLREYKVDRSLAQIPPDFRDEKYLWHVIGEEIAVGASMVKGKPRFIAATRVSFTVKSLKGLSYYFTPKNIQKRFRIEWQGTVMSLTPPRGQRLHLARFRDILLCSNSHKWLEKSLDHLWGDKSKLAEKIGDYREERDGARVFFYADGEELYQHIRPHIANGTVAMKHTLDISHIKRYYGDIRFGEHLEFSLDAHHDWPKTSEYFRALCKKQQVDARELEFLPANAFIASSFPIVAERLWDSIYQELPQRWQQECDTALRRVRLSDFPRRFSQNLQDKIIIAAIPVDYSRAEIQPIDRYPAFGLFLQTATPQELYIEVDAILQQQKPQQLKSVKIEEASYAGRRYIQIDLGVLDYTAGALRPAIGTIDDFLFIVSHPAFLRKVYDAKDAIEDSLATQFAAISPPSEATYLNFDSQGIVTWIDDSKQQWARAMAINLRNQNRLQTPVEILEKNFIKQLSKQLAYVKIYHIMGIMQISHTLQKSTLSGKMLFQISD